MARPGEPGPPRLEAEPARSLAQALHEMRRSGGEHRSLREHIANRLRVKKGVAEALYERFDRGWHAGVNASLDKNGVQPSLQDDPLGHFAFEAARFGTSRLIAERTTPPDAAAAAPAATQMTRARQSFLGSNLIVAAIAVAVAWLFSDAAGWKLPAVLLAAGSVAYLISLQRATVIENSVMVGIVLLIAFAAASAGFGEVFWPSAFGAVVGALSGMLQRARERAGGG